MLIVTAASVVEGSPIEAFAANASCCWQTVHVILWHLLCGVAADKFRIDDPTAQKIQMQRWKCY